MRTLLSKDARSVTAPAQASARSTGGDQSSSLIRTERRSPQYLRCLARPDAPGANKLDAAEIIESIAAEFGLGESTPIGCLAECYLGPPYQVHVLDLAGGIVEHYHGSQPLPLPFERARRLALHESYVAIEVYTDHLVCLRADGTAVEIKQ
jgi:hypothetical protein